MGDTNKLVGVTGTLTRRIAVLDIREGEAGIEVQIRDDHGHEYWTELDESISLD